MGCTIVAYDNRALCLTSVARGTATEDGASDVHILGVVGLLCRSLVAVTIHIDIRITRDGVATEITAEGTPVATGPNGTANAKGSHSIIDARSRLLVRRVLDGVLTDEDIDGTEAVAEVTCGIHILIDDTTADVGDTHGSCRGAGREGSIGQRGVVTIVGVARAAVHVAVDMAARHIDRAHTSNEHLLLFTKGTAKHMTTDDTVGDVDSGGHL